MKRLATALALVVTLAAPIPPPASAQAYCPPGYLNTASMGGVYSDSQSMAIQVSPCGDFDIFWCNSYGCHEAWYYAYSPIPGGGWYTKLYRPDAVWGVGLDGVQIVGMKPAEPGYVQVITTPSFDLRVYRLMKTR